MDVVIVGLPGSGKSVVGRRLAHRTSATFVDIDAGIERASGTTIARLFEREGEPAFRALERAAIEALGPPDGAPEVRRVISTGGGAVVDPRNRWRLYRGRLAIWLDARPEVLAQRLRHSRTVRPLVTRGDPVGTVRSLARERERFYAAAIRVSGVAEVGSVLDGVANAIAVAREKPRAGTTLLRAETQIGTLTIGESIAAGVVGAALDRLGAPRAILVSEPGAWSASGASLADELRAQGHAVVTVMLPQGEAAKRLSVVEEAARELARLRVERSEPLVAIGGGALGDAAGFLAATYLRGVPLIHVPTTLVAQIDSSIGGKTAVDLPEGKNLVGAFHQPAAIVIDVALLAGLPERQRRAALGEAVKMAMLGDERLLRLLETAGPQVAAGSDSALESGAIAEIVERCAWAKVAVVLADEREQSAVVTGGVPGRMALNLGHSVGHALEAAGGYEQLLHGEAVAWGLRAACRIGGRLGLTPIDRATRVERLLDRLGLGVGRLALDPGDVRSALSTDKKHAGGRLHWVLPTADSVEVRADVPEQLVDDVIDDLLAPGAAGIGARSLNTRGVGEPHEAAAER
jgi:shikimate kinase/3-dehydroquinate synthase